MHSLTHRRQYNTLYNTPVLRYSTQMPKSNPEVSYAIVKQIIIDRKPYDIPKKCGEVCY